jgi:hypothetical protein
MFAYHFRKYAGPAHTVKLFFHRHCRYRLHRQELDAIGDPEQRHRRLVELNVIEQCLNLFKTGAVQRKRVDNYKLGKRSRMDGDDAGEEFHTTPRIHACVFDPKTGDMNRLKVSRCIGGIGDDRLFATNTRNSHFVASLEG